MVGCPPPSSLPKPSQPARTASQPAQPAQTAQPAPEVSKRRKVWEPIRTQAVGTHIWLPDASRNFQISPALPDAFQMPPQNSRKLWEPLSGFQMLPDISSPPHTFQLRPEASRKLWEPLSGFQILPDPSSSLKISPDPHRCLLDAATCFRDAPRYSQMLPRYVQMHPRCFLDASQIRSKCTQAVGTPVRPLPNPHPPHTLKQNICSTQ